jgi:hypothetical protein
VTRREKVEYVRAKPVSYPGLVCFAFERSELKEDSDVGFERWLNPPPGGKRPAFRQADFAPFSRSLQERPGGRPVAAWMRGRPGGHPQRSLLQEGSLGLLVRTCANLGLGNASIRFGLNAV